MKNSKPNTRVKNMSGSGSKKMKKEFDQKIKDLINAERTSRGLQPFIANTLLDQAAVLKTKR